MPDSRSNGERERVANPNTVIHLVIRDDRLEILRNDNSIVEVQLRDFKKLKQATNEQLSKFAIIGKYQGIHWTQFDEDLDIQTLIKDYDGFAIQDVATERRYIDVVFSTQAIAEAELASLLRGFPVDHYWVKRLAVVPKGRAKRYTKPKSAGGNGGTGSRYGKRWQRIRLDQEPAEPGPKRPEQKT